MINKKEQFVKMSKRSAVGAVLVVLIAATGATQLGAQNSPAATNTEKQAMSKQSKFYCNTKALTPEERAHHKQLSEKLMTTRKEIVETATGYEFRYGPKNVSLAELADWVAAESKCCPFFDFHIDVEREGNLLCLRLTGEEGIKAFIQEEFQVATAK
jgi:hypothetical protein